MRQPDKFFRNLCVVVIVVASLAVLYIARDLIAPVLCALLFAYVLFPLLQKATSIGVPKGLSIFVIFILMFMGIFYSIYKIIPAIKQEVDVFTAENQTDENHQSTLVRIARDISKQLHDYKVIEEEWEPNEIIITLKHWVSQQSTLILNNIGGAAKQTFQFVMIFLFVFVFSLLDGEQFYKTLVQLIPNSVFEPGVFILRKTTDLFGYYLRGLVIENLILGIVAFVLLVIVGYFTSLSITLAFVIAFVIAATNVIRIVGPIIGGAAGILLVLVYSADLQAMLGVLIVATIVQTLDNVAVLPLVMQDQVDIHPVLCLLSVLAGGMIAGILGMMLAIPVSGAIKVIYHIITIEMKKFNMDPEPR